jgi:hypothetical protein
VFEDGFETGDASRWSAVEPPPPCQITVTDPGNNDVWQMGTTRSIRWTTFGGCDPTLRIVLRRNGAAVRTIDDSTPDDGLYPWTIPTDLTPADDYRIRVREVGGARDDSTGEFTLSEPSLTPSVTPSATSAPTPSATPTIGPTMPPTTVPTPSATPTIGPTQPPNVMPFNR